MTESFSFCKETHNKAYCVGSRLKYTLKIVYAFLSKLRDYRSSIVLYQRPVSSFKSAWSDDDTYLQETMHV